jgi:hypothetical protein
VSFITEYISSHCCFMNFILRHVSIQTSRGRHEPNLLDICTDGNTKWTQIACEDFIPYPRFLSPAQVYSTSTPLPGTLGTVGGES